MKSMSLGIITVFCRMYDECMMKIVTQDEGNVIIFKVDGDIECFTVPQLKEAFSQQLVKSPSHIIIDMADVTYVDSSAIGLFVSTHQSMEKLGYGLGLVNVNKETMQLFKLTYVDQILEIYSSYDDFKKLN